MAAQSAWRSNNSGGNTPRWGNSATNNVQAHQRPSNNGDANAVPNATSATTTGSFPPLGNKAAHSAGLDEEESIQRDRTLHLLIGLIGHSVVVTTRSGSKHVGILQTTSAPDNHSANGTGVVLSVSQQIHSDGRLGAVQKTLLIKAEDVAGISAREVGLDVQPTMSHAERLGFRTDTQISNSNNTLDQQRSLEKWIGDSETDMALESTGGSTNNALGGWDQFAANEAKFGVKSNYEETMYTTKLDKTGKDYKERERKADQLAKEIMSSAPTNSHIAEERNLANAEGATVQTEEDKYGAVVRGANAYLPPGARRAAAAAAAATASASATARMNGSSTVEGERADSMSSSVTPSIVTTAPSNATAITAVSGSKDEKTAADKQQNKDAAGDFRQFVSQERERAERKKAALAKQEKDNKLADLKSWSDKFKLNFPVPKDLVGASQTQQASKKDVKANPQASETPRDPSLQKSVSPTPGNGKKTADSIENSGSASAMHSPTAAGIVSPSGQASMNDTGHVAKRAPTVASSANSVASKLAESKAMLAKMTIPTIPPYDPAKARARQAQNATSTSKQALNDTDVSSKEAVSSKNSFKMSAKASSFKPFNPNAATFTPGMSTNSSAPRPPQDLSFGMSPSPVIRSETPLNPFFGNRVIKKPTQPLHVQKEFSPFKTGKVPEPSTVGPTWDFTGKPHRDLFHIIPAEVGGSSSQQTPHLPHLNASQTGVNNPGVNMGGNGLPPGVHLPPPHMVAQQQVPPHLSGLPPHQGQLAHGGPHQVQQSIPGTPHMGQNNPGNPSQHGGQPSLNQPMYLQYQPYRLQHGQQPMQHLGASPYMTAGFMGQMPFSPPMPPAGAPGGMYSPQMQNMMSMPGGQMHNNNNNHVHPHMRGHAGGPPHMQGGKGQPPPPHLYYQGATGQPVPGLPYGQPFPPSAGPSPVIRHQQQHQQQQHQHHPQHHQHIPQQYQGHQPYGLGNLQQPGHQQQQSIPSSASVQTSLSNAPSTQTAPTSGNVSEAGSQTPMSGQGAGN